MGGEAKHCSNGRCSGLSPYDDEEETEREGKGGGEDGREGKGKGEQKRREGRTEGELPFKATFSMAYFFLVPTTAQ